MDREFIKVTFPSVIKIEDAESFLNTSDGVDKVSLKTMLLFCEKYVQEFTRILFEPTEVIFYNNTIKTEEDFLKCKHIPFNPIVKFIEAKNGFVKYIAGCEKIPEKLKMATLHILFKLYYKREINLIGLENILRSNNVLW